MLIDTAPLTGALSDIRPLKYQVWEQERPIDCMAWSSAPRHRADLAVRLADWMPWNYSGSANRRDRVISWFGRMAESILLQPCSGIAE
jgi:hypothetical protein